MGYGDRVAGAAITAGSARPGLPGANVGTPLTGQVWRSQAAVTASYLLADLGAQYPIGAVYMGAHNLTATGTWRVRLSTVDATGAAGNAHDSTAIPTGISVAYGIAVRIFSAPATGRYLRIDLSDAAVPYLEVGRLWAGKAFTPAIGYEFGASRLSRDFSRKSQGNDGQDWVLRASIQRGLSFSLPAITTTEATADGEAIVKQVGTSQDMLVCLNPTATDIGRETYLGLCDEPSAWEVSFPGHEKTSFRIWHRI